MSFVLTTSTAKVYKLRPDENEMSIWADCTIRKWKGGGSIDCQSSEGTFSNYWNHIGNDDFLKFLISLDFGYFMEKAYPNYKEFDFDKSVQYIKEHIIDDRKQGELTKEDARILWRAMSNIEWQSDSKFFVDELIREDIAELLYSNDFSSIPLIHSAKYGAVLFWHKIWPELCSAWKEELGD